MRTGYSYDSVSRLLTVLHQANDVILNPARYAYDANGNTLSDPSGKSYTWDFENRLISATVPGTGTVNFKYDPFGRRIYKSSPTWTGAFLYDRENLIETVSSSGTVVADYTDSHAIDEPLAQLRSGTASFYEQDGLGSVTSLSNGTGALANTYSYDSFGNVTSSTGTIRNPFQYTGRELDSETGVYNYRERYYDPTIGRFQSEDPMGFIAGVNHYSYVGNRATVLNDPLGLCPDKGTHDCYNAFINGTKVGWLIGFESYGPANVPGVNDNAGPMVILTVSGPALGWGLGKIFPWVKTYGKILVPVSVAATIADMLILEGCAVQQTLVTPGSEIPPGVNPYDPNDPWNWGTSTIPLN